MNFSNSTKVWLFLVGCSIVLLLIGYTTGERLGLLLGFLLAVAFNFLIFYFGNSKILSSYNAQAILGSDCWSLNEITFKFAKRIGVPVPNVYLIENSSAAIFCIGHTWKKGSIGLTTGLLNTLSREELEAVIAHQICQIRRLDSFAFGVMSTIANSVFGLGVLLDQWITRPLSLGDLKLFTHLLSPLAGLFLSLVSTKQTFYKNDQYAATHIPDRNILAEALWKIDGLSMTRPLTVPDCSTHLFIVDPQGLKNNNIFLRAHPPIEERIKRLVGYFPI